MFMEMSLLLYLVGNVYLLRRAWKALAGTGIFRQVLLVAYLVFSYSYFLWHRLERGEPSRLKEAVCASGAFYPGLLLYLVLFTALVDVLRLVDRVFPFLPEAFRRDRRRAGKAAFAAVVAATSVLLVFGLFHARYVRVRDMDVAIDKSAGGLESLNLVVLSDLHVGPYMRTSRLGGIIEKVKALDPDVVLLLGDVMNEETIRPERERLPGTLAKLKARYGVFACLGNHEHFAGLDSSLELFRKSGIRLLANEAALVADSFYIVGRSNRRYIAHQEKRLPLADILKGVDMLRPVILMDHQPVRLEEAAGAGVDLQLSGHTHGGGVFPVTLVNDRLYEIGRGYGRKGNTQYYVTTGVGVWSPPIRVGTTSEIVRMRITFRR